jgi:PhnB protein
MKILEMYPYIRVKNAAHAIDFYKAAFGVTEKFRIVESSGRIGHCELEFGGAVLMLSDEYPEYDIRGPESVGATTFCVHLHVDDADRAVARAVEAGAQVIRPLQDRPHGERSGAVRDPFGHEWLIGHSIEEVTPEEMQRRYEALDRA